MRELQVHRGNRNSPMQSFQWCVLQCCQARRSWRPRWWCCGSGRHLWSPHWRPSESWSEPAGSSLPWALSGRQRWERVSDRVTEGGASERTSRGWFESSAVNRAAGFKSDDSLFTLKLCIFMRDAHFTHRQREAAVTFRPSAQQEVHVFCVHPPLSFSGWMTTFQEDTNRRLWYFVGKIKATNHWRSKKHVAVDPACVWVHVYY